MPRGFRSHSSQSTSSDRDMQESCSHEHRKWSPREVAVSRVSGRNVRDGKFGKPDVTRRFQRTAKGIQPSVPALPTEQAFWPRLWDVPRVLSGRPSTGTRIHYLNAASLDVIEKEAQRERGAVKPVDSATCHRA